MTPRKPRATASPGPAGEPRTAKRKLRASVAPREIAASGDVLRQSAAELEAARDRAIIDPAEDERPEHQDPLRDFLACYDDGDVVRAFDASDRSSDAEAKKRFLIFEIAGETYAASIMDIKEILKFVAITEVPRAPREVLGVLSKRGVVMPVVDLGAILGLRAPAPGQEREQRVLVAGEGDRICGLRVDRVREVVRLLPKAIEDVPASLGAEYAHMLRGLSRAPVAEGGPTRMLIVLNIPAVLAHFSLAMGIVAAPLGETP